jgi:arginase
VDRDADLNTPATTPSGRVDGMVVAHIAGRGAAELVRFWGEAPLVREPDVLLFGVDRLDPGEQEFLNRSPMPRMLAADVQRMGAAAGARHALERLHADGREFVLHFDVDVIAEEDMAADDVPGSGGLRLAEVREALRVMLAHKNLLALDVAEYQPEKDADGSGAKTIVDLLVEALAARLETLTAPPAPTAEEPAPAAPEPSGTASA